MPKTLPPSDAEPAEVEEVSPAPSEGPAIRVVRVGDLEATGHLVCAECGRIVRWRLPPATQRDLADLALTSPEGWDVHTVAVSFTGTCSFCRRGAPRRT